MSWFEEKHMQEMLNRGVCDMRVLFKTPFELGMLFPSKDRIVMELRALVVYRIGCYNGDSFYIGKTKRCLKIRRA
jgi:hypothetical protein